jgi:hypothetical protein
MTEALDAMVKAMANPTPKYILKGRRFFQPYSVEVDSPEDAAATT